MALILSDGDVRALLGMADAIEAIEAALREQAAGDALFSERQTLMLPNGWIRTASAALPARGYLGYKEFHLNKATGVRYGVHLFDYETGEPLAIMDGNWITQARTGATAGVALKHLAPHQVRHVGIIGSGSEARTELEALASVREVGAARVFSPSPERRERFAREMRERVGVDVTAVGSPQEAIDGCEVVLAATNTGDRGPALLGQWLAPGVHVNSVGSTLPSQRELDEAVWSLADRIVIDAGAVLTESGDAIAAREAGTLDEGKAVHLHDVVTGAQPGRTGPEETTLYKSVGTPVQDLAAAAFVYERARDRGYGTDRENFQSLKSFSA